MDGCEYAAALSQRMYIGLAEALEDVAACSRGVNMQELQALTVTWVASETEACV